jgi:hypothetical protein
MVSKLNPERGCAIDELKLNSVSCMVGMNCVLLLFCIFLDDDHEKQENKNDPCCVRSLKIISFVFASFGASHFHIQKTLEEKEPTVIVESDLDLARVLGVHRQSFIEHYLMNHRWDEATRYVHLDD